MSIALFFPAPANQLQLRVGPVACDIDGFAEHLAGEGFAPATAKDKLRCIRDLSRWLDGQGLGIEALNEDRVEAFLRDRGRKRRRDAATCRTLLSYLRGCGRIPLPPNCENAATPTERLVQAYERFLAQERGLTSATVVNYVPTVRAFLAERFAGEELRLATLTPQDANRFLLRHSQRVSWSRAKLLVTALRSFLRFLHQRGDIAVDLASGVLPVMHWRLSGLPKSLAPEQVHAVLTNCQKDTVGGRRDYAALLLMARLGLRAGEVVAMTLDDVDWEAGLVTVRGKGQRQEPLPLPQEVGEALVAYLRAGRPTCNTRRLFVRLKAPYHGFSSSVAICDIVRRALARAGIDVPFKGSHLLRHSLATEMLRHGASLEDIGEILRHRHPETTQIYAKVDLNALRTLAPAWPGGVS